MAEAKSKLALAIAAVAKKLGNTPAVCRKSYVHPAVIERYLDDRLLELPRTRPAAATAGLEADEVRVLAFLRENARRDEAGERLARLERSVAKAARSRRERM